MSVLWTSADAVAATGGVSAADWDASGISIDTRSIEPGDLFVALTDVRDGHDFVAQALEKGAAAALVSRIPDGVPADAPLLIVDDVLAGLRAMASAARARTDAKVVGVTGSVGKTSTKEMLRAALVGQGNIHAAERSFNNHWGVPLTLARMPADTDYAIIEIGMSNPGEIAPLAQLARLDVAMITNVAAVHFEAFENIDAIAREKASIFQGLISDGVVVLNADMDVLSVVTDLLSSNHKSVMFGEASGADFRLDEAKLINELTVVSGQAGDDPVLFKLQTAGRHFALNAMGVLAVVDALGADVALAAISLGQWQPPAGRGKRETIVMDIVDDHLTFELLDDAYNANPTSMAAAIEVLSLTKPNGRQDRVTEGRRIAVLGDMLELGPNEAALHRDVAKYAGIEDVDRIHCVGPRMRALYDVLPDHQRGKRFETASELASLAHVIVGAGDVIMVKGSLGSRVGLVVEALKKLGQPLVDQE